MLRIAASVVLAGVVLNLLLLPIGPGGADSQDDPQADPRA